MLRSFQLFALISLCLGASVHASDQTYHVRRQDSMFGFEIYKWLVFKEEGRFRSFHGTIAYDPARPENTKVEVFIDVASVDSRDTDRDQVIRSREYFDAARYPVMSFRSSSARPGGRDTLLVEGDITIRGVSRHISVPMRVLGLHEGPRGVGSLLGFEGSFVVSRRQFGIAPDTNMLSDEVTIRLLVGASTVEESGGKQ